MIGIANHSNSDVEFLSQHYVPTGNEVCAHIGVWLSVLNLISFDPHSLS